MDQQTRLVALAHLHNGLKPADAAERTGISYASALKLKKELNRAKEKNAILDLFELNKAALDILLNGVKQQLMPIAEDIDAVEALDGEIQTITKGIEGGKLLNEDFQDAARAIANKIAVSATTTNSAESVLHLSKALCELQNAFFSREATPASHLPMSTFEEHLGN